MGYQIKSEIKYDVPAIIVFVSSFCSKCHYTKQQLHKYLDTSEIVEINIASSDELLEELQPTSVPTIMVVDKEQRIVSYFDSMISDPSVMVLTNLLRNLRLLDNTLE